MAISTLVTGVVPAAIASVGGLFVDAVANSLQQNSNDFSDFRQEVLIYVLIELGLVLLLTASQRLNMLCQSILRALLGNKINVMILEKALTLELGHFEDSEYYFFLLWPLTSMLVLFGSLRLLSLNKVFFWRRYYWPEHGNH